LSLSKTKEILNIHKIIPKKKLGQNFMIDFSIFYKLVDYANLREKDIVLDIGAGLGYLTKFLAKRCKKVVAIEKDIAIANILENQLQNFDNVSFINADILKTRLPKFNKIISIPPYYLSSKLIEWLFLQKFECAVFILQDDFVKKLTAVPNSQEYSWLTIITQYYANVDQMDLMKPEKFYPKPEVDSRIVRITPYKNHIDHIDDSSFFSKFVKHLFSNRNKKLVNTLHSFLKSNYRFSKTDTKKYLARFGFTTKRVRQLTVQEFGELVYALPK
jgi:16S rRNA (adenine1518-N6/adenine1519-N6)-dimethyltransferase